MFTNFKVYKITRGSWKLYRYKKLILNNARQTSVSKISANSQGLEMSIKTEEVEIESEPEATAGSSSNEATRDVKTDPERQWLECLNNDEIKKEPLGRTCEKCGRITMVKNHKCQFRCKICDKKLKSIRTLIDHLQNVHRAEPDCKFFECDFCGLRFLHKGHLIRHLKLKHKGGKIEKFQCDFDGKRFTSKNKFLTHMKTCHCAASKCKICGKGVKRMKIHLMMVHSAERMTVACKICKKSFKNKILLAMHLKTHNKQFECHVCDQKYPISYQLKAHLKFHNDPGAFQCKICFKSFNRPSNLAGHMKTHDKNRVKSHQCEHCDYTTYTKAKLNNHLKTHDQNRIKDLKCTKCDHTTDDKSNFKKHLESHNPQRAIFPCPQCDYITNLKQALKNHIRTHDKNRTKNFKCTFCEKSFYDKSLLKSHLKIHDKNRVMFPCPQCKHKATTNRHLKTHIINMHDKKIC
jgi:KRAB domain-containing zinc finger protein